MVCLLVLCGLVGLVTLGNPAPAYPASHNDQPIPAVIIIIIINILFFNIIKWYSVMATVGSWGCVERSSRSLHSIPPLHHTLNSRNTIHSLEMKFVLCVQSIANNSDLQNHWWSFNAVSCEQIAVFSSHQAWGCCGEKQISAVDCTAVAQAETHRCYVMLVPE